MPMILEQIVDAHVLQLVEQIPEVVQTFTQKHISERNLEHRVDVPLQVFLKHRVSS